MSGLSIGTPSGRWGATPIKKKQPQQSPKSISRPSGVWGPSTVKPKKKTKVSPRKPQQFEIYRKGGQNEIYTPGSPTGMVPDDVGSPSAFAKTKVTEHRRIGFKGTTQEAPAAQSVDVALAVTSKKEHVYRPLLDIQAAKVELVHLVSGSLIREPRLKLANDRVRVELIERVNSITPLDPEFILKMALYSRQDLNIRTTSNFLLALAADVIPCRAFLRKYFAMSVRLPSDMLEVAEIYNTLENRSMQAYPTALRRVFVDKFVDFDVYQLGKYKSKGKPKKKKGDKAGKTKVEDDRPKQSITMKHLIRVLHISRPVDHVMCILGKRYPANLQEFHDSGLPGDFDEARAGKRMKLPTPETWETQVSSKGNKASTWEELINHRKLPFMALLRNLRNLIVTGISDRHHKTVLERLTNETTVIGSRQFPFRFFSAYDAVSGALEQAQKNINAKKLQDSQKKKKWTKKINVPSNAPTPELIQRYKSALDTAVKIATKHNCKPVKGYTVVLCNVSGTSDGENSSASRLGASVRSTKEIGILLGLMCKHVAEVCDFRVYASPAPGSIESDLAVELIDGTILDNMRVVSEEASKKLGGGNEFPYAFLEGLLRSKRKIDNLLVLSSEVIGRSPQAEGTTGIADMRAFLHKYRQEVNPDLLYVSVDLSARNTGIVAGNETTHPNDVFVSGFSGEILSFMAERGDTNQLQYVEMIDEVRNLTTTRTPGAALKRKPLFEDPEALKKKKKSNFSFSKEPKALEDVPRVLPKKARPAGRRPGEWATARVFISSTFLDMHGERDVLTQYVFPELRKRAAANRVHVAEVDLRWGITAGQSGDVLEVCLTEVDRCRPFFIGLLGDRYGYCPEEYKLPDEERFDWTKEYPSGRSVTELEMQYGVLQDPQSTYGFFYKRDPNFTHLVPNDPDLQRAFIGSTEARSRLEALKERITSNCNSYTYPASWGGVVDGKPMAANLDAFAKRVLEDLWAAIQDAFPADTTPEDPRLATLAHHERIVEEHTRCFFGKEKVLQSLVDFADGPASGVASLLGGLGSGKSAVLAQFIKTYAASCEKTGGAKVKGGKGKELLPVCVLPHFIGAGPGSTDVRRVLHRLSVEVCTFFNLPIDEIPEDYVELKQYFGLLLSEVARYGRVIVVLDGLDKLVPLHNGRSLDWLPSPCPVHVIVSTLEGETLDALRARQTPVTEINVGPLAFHERREIIRTILWQYRKKLDEAAFSNQLKLLTGKKDAPSPLYLVVACEELRVFGVFEKVTDKLRKLAPTIPRLMEEVLTRLEADHGQELVAAALGLIACARGGLAETELAAGLQACLGHAVGPAIWRRLALSLDTFLRESDDDGGNLDIFHTAFRAAIVKRYLVGPAASKYHRALAAHFAAVGDPTLDKTWRGTSARAVGALPYHLLQAGDHKKLAELLQSLHFIEAKCRLGGAYDLVGDYNAALERNRGPVELEHFSRFVAANAHVLARAPALAYQQAANEPESSHVAAAAASTSATATWLQWLNKPAEFDPCKMTITSNTQAITAVATSADGLRIASAGRDTTIKLFHLETGAQLSSLLGHKNTVSAVDFSPDRARLVSGSYDCLVITWDVVKGVPLVTCKGHRRRISDVKWSPDGRKLASSSWDSSVKIWNADSGKIIYTMDGHNGPVNSISFSADAFFLASASWDRTVRLWNVRRGKEEKTLKGGHTASVRGVSYSPNKKQIASVSVDSSLVMWSAETGKLLGKFVGHAGAINSVAFSADGETLVSCGDDRTVKVWSGKIGRRTNTFQAGEAGAHCVALSPNQQMVALGMGDCTIRTFARGSGHLVDTLTGHTGTINCVSYSGDGRRIASGSLDNLVMVWTPGRSEPLGTCKGHRGGVNCVKFHDNDLVSAGDDNTIIIWNLRTFEETRRLDAHTNFVRDLSFSPNKSQLASVGRDNRLIVWKYATGKICTDKHVTKDWLNCVEWSPSGSFIATGAWDFVVQLYDSATLAVIRTFVGHDACIASVSFNDDETLLVTSDFQGVLKVWDVQDGTELTTLKVAEEAVSGAKFTANNTIVVSCEDGTGSIWDPLEATELAMLTGHASAVRGVVTAPGQGSSLRLVSTSDDCTVKVWEVEDGPARAKHRSVVSGVAFHGSSLYSSGEDGSIKAWRVSDSTLHEDATMSGEPPSISSISVSPNGHLIASTSSDNTAWLWDTQLAAPKKAIRGAHSNTLTAVAFSPTGQHIATASWDCSVCVTDLKGKQVAKLLGHTDWVRAVAWAPDGKRLATAGYDNTVRIWTAQGGVLQSTCTGHTNWVRSVAWSPDGKTILSASYDGTVRLWDGRVGTQLRAISSSYKATEGEDVDDATVEVAMARARVAAAVFTSDGRFIVAGGDDCRVKLYAASSGKMVAEFVGRAPISSIAVTDRSAPVPLMAFGDSLGNVCLTKLMLQ